MPYQYAVFQSEINKNTKSTNHPMLLHYCVDALLLLFHICTLFHIFGLDGAIFIDRKSMICIKVKQEETVRDGPIGFCERFISPLHHTQYKRLTCPGQHLLWITFIFHVPPHYFFHVSITSTKCLLAESKREALILKGGRLTLTSEGC